MLELNEISTFDWKTWIHYLVINFYETVFQIRGIAPFVSMQLRTVKYHTMQYHAIQVSKGHYHAISCMHYCSILYNTTECPCNIIQYLLYLMKYLLYTFFMSCISLLFWQNVHHLANDPQHHLKKLIAECNREGQFLRNIWKTFLAY